MKQRFTIPIWEIGPLLVLKLNAFAGRQHGKDAYDILLCVSNYLGGPRAAVRAFQAEGEMGNRGFAAAREALKLYFSEMTHSGPVRGVRRSP